MCLAIVENVWFYACKGEVLHLGNVRFGRCHEAQGIAGGNPPETVAVAAKEM